MTQKIKIIFTGIICLFSMIVQAKTVYVIDELKIGLHESATINSPIVKLVPSGTELSVIEHGDGFVKVKEPTGTEGWINNKYLVDKKPDKVRVNKPEKEIALLKSDTTQEDLAQQLKSERLKSGQLEARLADLKTRIANIDNSDQLLSEIEQLKQENNQLRTQLKSSGIEVQTDLGTIANDLVVLRGWKQYLSAFIIMFIIGMVAGAFILDFLNRRRHGGFRI